MADSVIQIRVLERIEQVLDRIDNRLQVIENHLLYCLEPKSKEEEDTKQLLTEDKNKQDEEYYKSLESRFNNHNK